MRFARYLMLLAAAVAAQAQSYDNSGNSMLNGKYYFRQVIYSIGDTAGDLSQGISLYGNITFSGNGTYTISGEVDYECVTSGCGTGVAGKQYSNSGTYSIAASGYGFISNPFAARITSGTTAVDANIYGLVSSQGIFVSSATESGINDLFIAAPLASPLPTNSSFTGTWTCAYFDSYYPGYVTATNAETAMFNLTADGAGHINMTGTGYYGGYAYTQNVTGVPYNFSNGAANVTFPTNGAVIAGASYLYFSKDGTFMFGGSPQGFDFMVAVKPSSTAAASFSGLYYQAGIDDDSTYGELDTFYGSFYALTGNNCGGSLAGTNCVLGHERVQDALYSPTYDSSYSTSFLPGSNGSYSVTSSYGQTNYVLGVGGLRIGSGVGGFLRMEIALPAPTLAALPGVYLNPTEVRNAGNWAPFTAGIAPGELLVLRGTGLASGSLVQTQVLPFPKTLNKVSVSIGGINAPLYYVSPTQISAIVPYGVTGPVVPVQVNNNGTLSNVVTMLLRTVQPGILTQGSNGIGYGDILHSDYSLVTAAKPATAGENLSVYLTGLGAVSPAVADGAAGPSDTYAVVPSGSVNVYINGTAATVLYAGLAPTLGGLYQLNITVPTGLTAGDNYLEVDAGAFAGATATSLIPIGSNTSSAATAQVRQLRPLVREQPRTKRPLPSSMQTRPDGRPGR